MIGQWNGWQPTRGLLDGQVALVAGGAAGIGAAVTRIFAAAGAAVVILDRDEQAAPSLASEVITAGGQALAVVADLRSKLDCRGALERAIDFRGGLDILVNNAGGMSGYARARPLRDWTDEDWDAIVHLNLGYVFWMCRAVIPALQARGGGAIVNLATIGGLSGLPNKCAYGAAKAGLIQLTKTIAEECGPVGIRANAVTPGPTLTSEVREMMPPQVFTAFTAATPMRRLGNPEDVARAVLFFASPMSEHVTGQMLPVDGGVSINFPYPDLTSGPSS